MKHGLEAQAKLYPMMSPDPEQYPGEIIEKDLAQGKIDAAVVWGPIAGYYAKRVRNVELAVVPLRSEPGVKFDYEIAMGVRYGEPEWKASVQKLIGENQAAITAILREYNVPLVDERGEPVDQESRSRWAAPRDRPAACAASCSATRVRGARRRGAACSQSPVASPKGCSRLRSCWCRRAS